MRLDGMRRRPTRFDVVLAGLDRPDQGRDIGHRLPPIGLPCWDSGTRSRETLDRVMQAYGAPGMGGLDAPASSAEEEREAIRRELGLADIRTTRDLRQARRRFARANHPDRYPVWLRPRCLLRMAIANALIDEALQNRRER